MRKTGYDSIFNKFKNQQNIVENKILYAGIVLGYMNNKPLNSHQQIVAFIQKELKTHSTFITLPRIYGTKTID